MALTVPSNVQVIINHLSEAGFEAYAVGGAVRDALLGREATDWDVATNAKPEQIQEVFPKSLYTNRFGTVVVRVGGNKYEVTTYRLESAYSDSRHPDSVEWAGQLEDDLARRDFTINAMALAADGGVVDPFTGQADLASKQIRAVGNPAERFAEDALRLLRAVRLAAQLEFQIEPQTMTALQAAAPSLAKVSLERIRDEFMKLLASPDPARGVRLLIETRLIDEFLPELLEGAGMDQPKHHKFDVLEHNIRSLQHVPTDDVLVRLAALTHDIGKPRSAEGDGAARTFHNHEVIGAKMMRDVLRRLKFSNDDRQRVVNLVRHHMFLFQFESTDKAIRRIIRRVGPENVDDLIALRVGDRLGSGCREGYNKKLKIFRDRVEEVQQDPIDTRMLAIDGTRVMALIEQPPGPIIGQIMNALLEEILDDPARNTVDYLEARTKQLAQSLS